MEVTRQYWTVGSIGLFLAIWGVIVAEPLVFLGSGAVAAWLLIRQYRFVRAATRARSALTVDVTTPRQVSAEETYQLSLEAALEQSLPLTIDVSVLPPVGASGEPVSTELTAGDQHAVSQTMIGWPVAGSFAIDEIRATFTDDDGLFCQSVDLGMELTVQVNPRAPRDIHVGKGGKPIAAGLGDDEAGHFGISTELAEVREYVPGEAVRQIDWKATARLDHPHVKEFEEGTDRETLLFFDHRSMMADGRPGARKLDYARQLAVALVDQARERENALGYYAVGDEGLTATVSPAARIDSWTAIRKRLLAVTPTGSRGTADKQVSTTARTVARLDSDDSPFGRTLTPFFEARRTDRQQLDLLPLYQAVATANFSSNALVHTVVVTDDTDRIELRKTVKYARQNGDHVTVFLTPTVLFETADFTDLDRAYDRYVDFEEFRRELAGIDRVDAFEVGPDDRLSAVLSTGQERRARGSK